MIEFSLKKYKNANRKANNSNDENPFLNGNIILQLLPNQKDTIDCPSKYSYCNDVKIFKIDKYSISGIPFEKLYLTFFKDTLVKIDCNDNEKITEALTYKYGEAKVIKDIISIRCGDKFIDKTNTSKLWQNERLMAVTFLSDYFCVEQDYDSYFRIIAKGKFYDSYINCDKESKKSFIDRMRNIEKDKMKDKMKNF